MCSRVSSLEQEVEKEREGEGARVSLRWQKERREGERDEVESRRGGAGG
jgi:hypothetical protein